MSTDRLQRAVLTATGALFALSALSVPSSVWIGALRVPTPEMAPSLVAGAGLFRASLALLGVYLVLGAQRGWWRAGASAPSGSSTSGPAWILASVLLAAGAALRLYGLGRGLWADEVFTLVDYARLPLGEIVTTYGSQNQHLLYSALARLSVESFGESAWSLRLPAALFGIATLWSFWRFARELTGEREALLGMAMLTFSYHHVWFSQNARGYSALLFWTIVSSHLLLRALRQRSPHHWFGYAVVTALGMSTHMTMLFVVAGHLALYIWAERDRGGIAWPERLAPLFEGFVPAGLLTLACYAFVLPQIPQVMASEVSTVAEWRDPFWTIRELSRAVDTGGPAPLLAFVGLGIVGVGFVSYWRRSAELPILFAVPIALGAATMVASKHHLWPRFFFFAAGFGILLVVRGLSATAGWVGRGLKLPDGRSAALGTATAMFVILFLARSLPYVHRPKQDFVGAREFVAGGLRPGDAAVVVGTAAIPFRAYFAPDWLTASTAAELERIRASHARTWLVYTLPIAMRAEHPDVMEFVEREFIAVREFEGSLNGGTIYLFRADGQPASDDRANEGQDGN